MPVASVSVSVVATIPSPVTTRNRTSAPAFGAPDSVTITAGAEATFVLTIATCSSSDFRVAWPTSMPVAANVTEPDTPTAVTLMLFEPGRKSSVQAPTVATPSAPDCCTASTSSPLPETRAKVTATPAAALPAASVILTDGGCGTARPAVLVWLTADLALMTSVVPALMLITCSSPVRFDALNRSV